MGIAGLMGSHYTSEGDRRLPSSPGESFLSLYHIQLLHHRIFQYYHSIPAAGYKDISAVSMSLGQSERPAHGGGEVKDGLLDSIEDKISEIVARPAALIPSFGPLRSRNCKFPVYRMQFGHRTLAVYTFFFIQLSDTLSLVD